MHNLFTGFGASIYAFVTRSISLFRDINAIVANEILDRVASGIVLDVGTGPGNLPTCIAIKNPSLEVVGLGVSRDMIKIARANAESARGEYACPRR